MKMLLSFRHRPFLRSACIAACVQRLRVIAFLLLLFLVSQANAQPDTGRWAPGRAWEWYNRQRWYCGFNYIPAYAINYTAMWDRTSYDPKAIYRELALAEKSGMNVLRAVLQFAVYEENPARFLQTVDDFLSICNRHHIKFVPALFDDCVFGLEHDPHTGKQPEPLIGWYAWAWSPSPGHSLVVDASTHPRLRHYVMDVIERFRTDPRILMWDLYNEPTNGGLGTASMPLVEKVIDWARAAAPSQPITIAVWNNNKTLNQRILAASDIISFHNYGNLDVLNKQLTDLAAFGRPLICTEWMNRPAGSVINTHLPLFHDRKVGCMLWGLVNGKTQTDLPWGHRPGDPPARIWQHDLFRPDFTAYDSAEIAMISRLCKDANAHTARQ